MYALIPPEPSRADERNMRRHHQAAGSRYICDGQQDTCAEDIGRGTLKAD